MVEINKTDQTVEALPLRTSELHLNLTRIFIQTMGLSLEYLPGESNPALGEFMVNFTLAHPFDLHPEFTGFDIKGIVLSPGTLAVDSVVFSGYGETTLVNLDGYTRWWNSREFTQPGIFGYTEGLFTNTTAANLTATVNPYKLFADKLGPSDDLYPLHSEPLDGDMGRGLFSAGNSITRKYHLDFPLDPAPVIVFGYVIDGCWSEPSPNPPLEVPDDFPMVANQPEAYDIEFGPDFVTLYYDTESGTGGGQCEMRVSVYDWQGEEAGNVAGEIASVEFFAPDLFSGGVAATFEEEVDNKAVYSVDLTGIAVPTAAGMIPVVIKVTSAGGPNYNQGFSYPAPAEPVAAWEIMFMEIEDPDCTGDTSNEFSEAIPLDTENNTFDQMCTPTDYKDFYKFELQACEIATGTLTLYCDAVPTTMGLYDSTEALITEVSVSGGTAVLDFSSLNLSPGLYYIRLLAQAPSQAFLYMLEPDIYLGEPIPPLNPENVTPIGLNLYGGYLYSHGNYVYVAEDGVWIYDYTDPSNPVCLNFIDTGGTDISDFNYPYLYYSRSIGINDYDAGIIDISNPLDPVDYPEILWFPTEITAINGDGDYLYVGLYGAPHSMVRIFDISAGFDAPVLLHEFITLENPKKFGFVDEATGPSRWLAISENSYYMEFLDITDMGSLGATQVIDLSPKYSGIDIEAKDNYVFIIEKEAPNNYLTSIKLEASGPVLMGSAGFVGDAAFLDIEGNYAYLGSYIAMKFIVVDITNPDLPINPVIYSGGFYMLTDLTTCGNLLHLGCAAAGIETWSIQNPSSPSLIGREYGVNYVSDFAFTDEYIYLIANWSGYQNLKVIDISDPEDSHIVTEYLLTKGCDKVCVAGNRLVGASWDKFLELVDIADPLNPSTVNTVNNGVLIASLAMSDDALYVGNDSNNINVWGLSTWPAIAVADVVGLPGTPVDIFLDGDYMYVAAGPGIEIYSITNPLNPSYLGSYTSSATPPKMINIRGDNLLITSSDALEIADISSPGSPVFAGSLTIPYDFDGWYVDADDHFAYIKGFNNSVAYVIGMCPLDTPEMAGLMYDQELVGSCSGMVVHDGYYYEGTDGSLRIFRTGY
jgi:hypothetical protein